MLFEIWDSYKAISVGYDFKNFLSTNIATSRKSQRIVMQSLHEAVFSLRLKTRGPLTKVVEKAAVFDYFEEVRSLIERASTNLMFVDPYLDANFVRRYLAHIGEGVAVRLLTHKRWEPLVAAVEMYSIQHEANIQVRTASDLHDRWLFVDNLHCYQSGASFKDGAKNSSTTITQIVDAANVMLGVYDDKWNEATERFSTGH